MGGHINSLYSYNLKIFNLVDFIIKHKIMDSSEKYTFQHQLALYPCLGFAPMG
jgi:hypothetical protein